LGTAGRGRHSFVGLTIKKHEIEKLGATIFIWRKFVHVRNESPPSAHDNGLAPVPGFTLAGEPAQLLLDAAASAQCK